MSNPVQNKHSRDEQSSSYWQEEDSCDTYKVKSVTMAMFIAEDSVLNCIYSEFARCNVHLGYISQTKLKHGNIVKVVPYFTTAQEKSKKNTDASKVVRNLLIKYRLKFKEQKVLKIRPIKGKLNQISTIYKYLFCHLEVLSTGTDENNNLILEVSNPELAKDIIKNMSSHQPCEPVYRSNDCPCSYCRSEQSS